MKTAEGVLGANLSTIRCEITNFIFFDVALARPKQSSNISLERAMFWFLKKRYDENNLK